MITIKNIVKSSTEPSTDNLWIKDGNLAVYNTHGEWQFLGPSPEQIIDSIISVPVNVEPIRFPDDSPMPYDNTYEIEQYIQIQYSTLGELMTRSSTKIKVWFHYINDENPILLDGVLVRSHNAEMGGFHRTYKFETPNHWNIEGTLYLYIDETLNYQDGISWSKSID